LIYYALYHHNFYNHNLTLAKTQKDGKNEQNAQEKKEIVQYYESKPMTLEDIASNFTSIFKKNRNRKTIGDI
jgi:hypothetical protein